MSSKSLIDLIGNTPLIRLKGASDKTGCEILGKAEFMNPGQSIKDRAALNIIKRAELNGDLCPGGTVVEGTAGNTGIGLAMICSILGYKCKIVMPNTQSEEKKAAIKLYGAELIEVDAVPYSNPHNYIHISQEISKRSPNTIWANQFDNIANREAHIIGTGPEIYNQTSGNIDGFICSIGSGGTLGGVSLSLKKLNSKIKIALADPFGSKMFSYYKTGDLLSEGSSITEGIGQGRITRNLDGVIIDDAYRISDKEALNIIFDINKEEGICLGGSSGVNIAGAIRMAEDMGPGNTIVTILCDHGQRYQSKIYNPNFLRKKGLPVPVWMQS
ncbi:MAG: cysteine synthase A [Hellea sp.]|nr:cysteine synthase A [Hellea sp.]